MKKENKMSREVGYYSVKRFANHPEILAYCNGENFFCTGDPYSWEKNDFFWVSDKKIEPEKMPLVLEDGKMMEKRIGKINHICLGYGGYQDAQFGLSVDLTSKDGWGVSDFKGFWSTDTKSKGCKWTEKDRDESFAKTMRLINELLSKSNKKSLNDLKNVPVEVVFENQMLKSWRILEEVI